MANVERGELGVDVDGKRYLLRPTFDSLVELEDLTGKKLDDPNGPMELIKQGRLSGIRAVVWCVLHDVHGDEIATLKDASRWIERAGGVDPVMELLMRLFELHEAPAEPSTNGGGENPPDAQGGTGTSSLPALVGSA